MVTDADFASVAKSDYRQTRGAALAKSNARAFKHIAGDTYLVPSATVSGGGSGYLVDVAAGKCTCPDFEERGLPCKHQWAVRYSRHELAMPDGTTVVTEGVRITYPQNWPAYNRAQTEEKERVQILLRGLCDGISHAKREGRGRPRLPLGDAVYAATMKVYSTMSGRRATTDIRACEERSLVKAHAMVGTVTNVVTAVEVTEGHMHDSPQFGALVERTKANGFDVREVSADKAYLLPANLAAPLLRPPPNPPPIPDPPRLPSSPLRPTPPPCRASRTKS